MYLISSDVDCGFIVDKSVDTSVKVWLLRCCFPEKNLSENGSRRLNQAQSSNSSSDISTNLRSAKFMKRLIYK